MFLYGPSHGKDKPPEVQKLPIHPWTLDFEKVKLFAQELCIVNIVFFFSSSSMNLVFEEAKIYPLLSIVNKHIKCWVLPVHFSSFEHCEHSLANVERMPPVVVFHLFCWNIFYNLGKFIFGYFCIQHNEYCIIAWQMSNTMQHKCKYKYLYL